MPLTTQQFKWQNRDAAAHDVLQLVYHAPPYISELAARLLQAFRSQQILPALRAIVLDETRRDWQRIYALHAFASAPGDVLADDFQPITQMAILRREQRLKKSGQSRPTVDELRPDFLDDLAGLVDDHPINRQWFFSLLDAANPLIQSQFLQTQLVCTHSEAFQELVIERLLNLLNADLRLLNLSVVSDLLGHGTLAEHWLDTQFDRVLALCLAEPENELVKYIAHWWTRLDDALRHLVNDWDTKSVSMRHQGRQRPTESSDYHSAPSYSYLIGQYERALNTDKDAYGKLMRIARHWRGNIPMRAVATHLIGKLSLQFDVFPILSYLMRCGNVYWDDFLFDSPIRYEAGEGLLHMPTAATWEVLVDSYFIHPRDGLLHFQIDWIAHITDVLSGEIKDYTGSHYGERAHRPWFRALTQVTDEELIRMTK